MWSYLYGTASSVTNYVWSYAQYFMGYGQQEEPQQIADSKEREDIDHNDQTSSIVQETGGKQLTPPPPQHRDTHKEDRTTKEIPKRLTHVTRPRPARATKHLAHPSQQIEASEEKQEEEEIVAPVVQEPEPEILATPPKKPAGAVAIPGMMGIKFDPSAVKLKKSPNPKPSTPAQSDSGAVDFRSMLRKSP